MDSLHFKTKPIVHSQPKGGLSPLGVSTETHKEKERDSLYAQIQNPDHQIVNFDERNGYFPKSSAGANMQVIHGEIDAEGNDEDGPMRKPLATSRAKSPYTRHPTIDFDNLSWPSRGTLQRKEATEKENEERLAKLSGAVRTILECVGEDPDREGLLDTPERYAKAMLFFTRGYEENLRTILNGAVFHEDYDEMVILKDIEFFSLCEHHLVPFSGKMHIGYIPNRRVIGLSKIARVVEMFSRRLQVQERLTKQIGLALSEMLQPRGVAVVVESSHLCMVMRGVQKTGAITTTSCMLGHLQSTAQTREEFFNLINRR
ncbi:hypothetical protein ABW21_db0202793 [Orbilia brochopaga]|nr:hypothetical protein ABW21_db0202793 [Drechslerella brochopaga]